ncbi:hypothetical protein OH687_14065 [Burkholderia anthina]|nr:hypothetical protein OH687_14065 [Burkholderia anthina]
MPGGANGAPGLTQIESHFHYTQDGRDINMNPQRFLRSTSFNSS